jgi:phosphomannomutase
MKKFIFDIDGTLTPSRQKIDPEFKTFMIYFAIKNPVYLVTGSDRQKTLEQIGAGLYDSCKRVYNCSGSDVYEADKNVYRDIWELPKKVEKFLEDELAYSCFPIRNGVHIERRPGQVNFSILGRGKDPSVGREEYIKWDTERLEREDILDRLKNAFPDLAMTLGGQTGIDIGPKGSDKSQILRDFTKDDELHFFGDKMNEGGNDYSLAMAIASNMMGEAYNVEDYKETWKLLSKY